MVTIYGAIVSVLRTGFSRARDGLMVRQRSKKGSMANHAARVCSVDTRRQDLPSRFWAEGLVLGGNFPPGGLLLSQAFDSVLLGLGGAPLTE